MTPIDSRAAYASAAARTAAASSGSGTSGTSGEDQATAVANSSLANKEVFLQLLVTQIKNQDPLNPQDGVQFVSQLAQFTELEQSLGMRQDVGAIKDYLLKPASQATDSSTAA